ncbi:MAG: AI-2E family transporter [Oscillospiraceae bacterium]
MKINWNKKYTTIAVYSLIVVAVAVLFVVFVFKFDSFKQGFSWIGEVAAPFIIGLVVAYIVNPLMMWIERTFFRKLVEEPVPEKGIVLQKLESTRVGSSAVVKSLEKRSADVAKKTRRRRTLARALSVTIAYLLLIAIIAGICIAIVPSVANSLVDLSEKLPGYIDNLELFLNDFFANTPEISGLITDGFTALDTIIQKIASMIEPVAGDIIGSVSSGVIKFAYGLVTGLKNVVIGLIIGVYLLFAKDRLLAQCKKILFAFLKNSTCQRLFYVAGKSNAIFKNYVVSNLLDALVVLAIMSIGMVVMGMPYPMLIAVVCGVTNLIPFFGPFIGAIPCGILILLVDPVKVIWFALFVLILQQVDGNVIKPHLFGESIGLPALWVLVSITIGGGLFGIMGMLLGVPVFAVLYTLFAEFVTVKLKKKKMPENTGAYSGDTSLFLDGYEEDEMLNEIPPSADECQDSGEKTE